MSYNRISMGKNLPSQPASRLVTGDTQFMFQFYKPSIHFFPPHPDLETIMSQPALTQSMAKALNKCPLMLGNFNIHPDRSITLDYLPDKPNPPVLEFQQSSVTFSELEKANFSYSVAHKLGLAMDIPSGIITKDFDQPMVFVKFSYLKDGGLAFFSMVNHVALDGNAMFRCMAFWVIHHRSLSAKKLGIPEDLEEYAIYHKSKEHIEKGPIEISVDVTRTPQEIGQITCKRPENLQPHVFGISMVTLKALKQQVEKSGVLQGDQWVSINNVLAAFICQHVAQANSHSGVYSEGTWTLFQSLDMRRPLELPERSIGSPLILSECQATQEEIDSSDSFPNLALRIRQSVDKYTKEYCQDTLDWLNQTYQDLKVAEPWRHFWFTSLNTNQRAIGISSMTKIPIYECDFGCGRPAWCSIFNPRPNYVIVYPSRDNQSLHLYVTLEKPAMDCLRNNEVWNELTTFIN